MKPPQGIWRGHLILKKHESRAPSSLSVTAQDLFTLICDLSLSTCSSSCKMRSFSLISWSASEVAIVRKGLKTKTTKSIQNSKHSSVRHSWVTTEGTQTLKTTLKSQLPIASMWTPSTTCFELEEESLIPDKASPVSLNRDTPSISLFKLMGDFLETFVFSTSSRLSLQMRLTGSLATNTRFVSYLAKIECSVY